MLNKNLILKQIIADLIGKDSHRGVTLSYAWASNQFGHFSLGFIPTLILYVWFRDKGMYSDPSLHAAVYISLFWLLFEIYNFLKPLLIKEKISKEKHVKCKGEKTFRPKWLNLTYDTFTDLNFFWFGAFSLSIVIKFVFIKAIVVGILTVLLMMATRYWYITKIYQSYAEYPYQLRLSQWRCNISFDDKEKVLRFLDKQNINNHLLIFGSHGTGKSDLSVAMANELSIKHKESIYITANKLYSELQREGAVPNSNQKWNWKNAEILVIDDINPGGPIDRLVEPCDFMKIIDKFSDIPNQKNRLYFKNKNIIWVLGNSMGQNNKARIKTWVEMLVDIGVEKTRIETIKLKS